MNFTELVNAVYELTNRDDLVSVTKQAVKTATLKAHSSDFFSKDIYETGVEFEESLNRQSLDYISIVSNFRAFKYIRRVEDQTDSESTNFIEIVTADDLLGRYGEYKTDIAYVAGRVIEIRSSVAIDKLLLGCYVFPLVTEDNFSSWVADLYPDVIVFEAARVIFKTIGYDEQAVTYRELISEQYGLLRTNNLTDVGF